MSFSHKKSILEQIKDLDRDNAKARLEKAASYQKFIDSLNVHNKCLSPRIKLIFR